MKKKEQGFALITVLFLVVIIASMLSAYMVISQTELKLVKASRDSASGFNAAEAGLNIRAETIRNIFESYNYPAGTAPASIEDCFNGSAGTDDFACDSFTFNNQHEAVTMVSEPPGNPILTTIPPGEQFAGLNAQEFRYAVTSVGRNNQGSNEAILELTFKSRLVPMFQFGVFFEEDLEMFNGATLNLTGPVHTNGDLYMAPQDNGATELAGPVSMAGSLYRGKKDTPSCAGHSGTAKVRDPGSFLNLPLCSGSRPEVTDVGAWNDNILIGEDPVVVPPAEALDAFGDGLYWQRADLRLVLKLNGAEQPLRNFNGVDSSTGVYVFNPDNSVNKVATDALHSNSCQYTGGTEGFAGAPIKRVPGIDNSAPFSQAAFHNSLDSQRYVGQPYFNQGTAGHQQWRAVNSDYDEKGLIWDYIDKVSRPIGNTHKASPPFPDSLGNNRLTLHREYNHNSSLNEFQTVLEIDMQALLTCIGEHEDLAGGGILINDRKLNDITEQGLVFFLTVQGASSDDDHNNYAVRIRNGSELESSDTNHETVRGLTVISDQQVVVWGDYNLNSNWKPSAIIADAHFLLSNNWRDFSSEIPSVNPNWLRWRRGSNTTVNTAVLSGMKRTGNANGAAGRDIGNPGGGVINIFRFNEHFRDPGNGLTNNQFFTYQGSFVSLGPTLHTQSGWEPFNYYSAPNRTWAYDTRFNDPNKLPPMTPAFVYLRQELFVRNFDL